MDPFLAHHEHEIEELIGSTHERAKTLGLQYFSMLVELIRERLLGLPPQRPAPPQPTGPAGYAQSLLSRFYLPSAGGASAAPASDWYSALSSVVGSVTSPGKSREARAEELSASGTLLQQQMETMSRTEKAHYISAQRETLDFLRSTLAREEQTLGEDPETDDLAYGTPLRKNRSELSFDVVDDDDLGSRSASSKRASGGRWTSGWFGGNDHDSSGSSGAEYAARAVDEISRARTSGYDRY